MVIQTKLNLIKFKQVSEAISERQLDTLHKTVKSVSNFLFQSKLF